MLSRYSSGCASSSTPARSNPLPTTAGSQIVAHHGRAQPVEIGNHNPTLDPARDLIDETGQSGIAAQPEYRHLSAQPRHVIEAAHGVSDGPRMRRIVEKHRRPVAVNIFQMRGRLAVRDHQ